MIMANKTPPETTNENPSLKAPKQSIESVKDGLDKIDVPKTSSVLMTTSSTTWVNNAIVTCNNREKISTAVATLKALNKSVATAEATLGTLKSRVANAEATLGSLKTRATIKTSLGTFNIPMIPKCSSASTMSNGKVNTTTNNCPRLVVKNIPIAQTQQTNSSNSNKNNNNNSSNMNNINHGNANKSTMTNGISASTTSGTTCTNGNNSSTATSIPVENTELRIIIIDENWSQYCYRIKINTPFGKLINRFCQQVRKIDHKSVLFWYHGRLVEDDDTPKTLNIKDGEVILAHYIK